MCRAVQQKSFDKQFVRDYLETLDWNKQPPAPPLPAEVVRKTSEKYREAYERLTGGSYELARHFPGAGSAVIHGFGVAQGILARGAGIGAAIVGLICGIWFMASRERSCCRT